MQKHLRRLPLEGTKNTRDLGGYPCRGGKTRWGVFLRSDNPAELTAGDIALLAEYGLTDVVDLRRHDECMRMPSRLCGAQGVQVHQISLNNALHIVDFEGDLPGSMAGLYTTLLDDSRTETAQVMRALAEAPGAGLFHCAVGKDRTGVIAMLLLDLAGVAEADIVADYAVTDIYMREIFDQQSLAFKNADIPEHILRSLPASMERTLRHLRSHYTGAWDYLRGCGVEEPHLQALVEKFVQRD